MPGLADHRLVRLLLAEVLLVVGGELVVPAGLAEEDQEDLAAHVERGEQGGQQAQRPQGRAVVVGVGQDLVLRPEAGERRDARRSTASR